jgi:synaptic vesicle membrane protein VAT-1
LKRGRLQITGGPAVELVLEAIGGDSLRKGYRLLAPTDRLGMFGVSSAVANKTGGMFGMLSMLASTLASVQSAVPDECQ